MLYLASLAAVLLSSFFIIVWKIRNAETDESGTGQPGNGVSQPGKRTVRPVFQAKKEGNKDKPLHLMFSNFARI